MNFNIDHIAIVVNDIEHALRVYRDALGLTVEHSEDVPEENVRVAFLPLPQDRLRLELIQPLDTESGVARFLQKRGEGMHHIALAVDDVAEAMQTLAAEGLDLLSEEPQQNHYGRRYAFVHPKTAHGVLLELYERTYPRIVSNAAQEVIEEVRLAHEQALQFGQDIVEIYKQEREKRAALEVAYKKLDSAFDSMSDGFLVLNKELQVLEINRAGADMFELQREEALNHNLSSLMLGNDIERFTDQLRTPKPAKFTFRLEIIVPVNRTLAIFAAPLPDGSWALVLHDVTWEERVNNMRDEFLNLAAHELRTPLAGIIGFTSLLEQTAESQDLGEDTRSIVENILKSAERLRSTINDMLDFTLSDATNMPVKVMDLRTAVEDALVMLATLAQKHGIQLTVTLPDDPMQVFGNQKMIVTAIGHLIENGILFNKPNGTLQIEGVSTAAEHRLYFRDTGVGISRKELEYITQPFFQVDEHTTRRSTGLGLGLSIATRTLAMHQGQLEAESHLNEGSTFTLILPRFTPDNMRVARQSLHKIQQNFERQEQDEAVDTKTEQLISQLEAQLQETQSQNMAYARDLARLYQLQRADAERMKEQEAIITHTDRLALMGQLAASVAHDLSNLIGPILGYSQIILRHRESMDPNVADLIERILGTSRRANILLRQMVNLSGIHSEDFEWFDLNALIQEVLLILAVRLRHNNVDVSTDYAEDLSMIYGNSVQISQVFLNIVINALDAMPNGGVLTIQTAARQIDGRAMAQVKVSDTGYGIAPENLAKIYEAFFTTKSGNGGTGLGLSVSKEIIDHHQGKIFVDSILDKGTSFTIWLPTQAGDAA